MAYDPYEGGICSSDSQAAEAETSEAERIQVNVREIGEPCAIFGHGGNDLLSCELRNVIFRTLFF